MDVIYQYTFFIALTLLAITITIFVLAVSLLGRAMEASAKIEAEKITDRKQLNIKQMVEIRKEIQEAEKDGNIPRGLRSRLDKLEEQDRKFDHELQKIRKTPNLLRVKGGVALTALFLIVALILSGTASQLSIFVGVHWLVAFSMWIMSLAALCYSVYRLYRCLTVIENVAVTSEETWVVKIIEAFKRAEHEIEEEKRPSLQLTWKSKPPFRIQADSGHALEFNVYLTKGEYSENTIVGFFLPQGFGFPGKATVTQEKDKSSVVSECITARADFTEPLTSGRSLGQQMQIKAPNKKGTYQGYYRVTCRGFLGKFEPFQIVVV